MPFCPLRQKPQDFFENFDEKNPKEIQKNADLIINKLKEKYEIFAIHVVFTASFDDPEVSNIISIVDGQENEDIRKHIFSSEITHVHVNSRKISEKKRIIYYLFAKIINE